MHDATKYVGVVDEWLYVAKEIENWKATSKKTFNVGMDLFQSRNLLYATAWLSNYIRPVVLLVEILAG